jgi:leucyl aminopeptidase
MSGKVRVEAGRPEDAVVDLLCIPVFGKDDDLADLPGVLRAVAPEWQRATSAGEFTRKAYSSFIVSTSGTSLKAAAVCFVGAGPHGEADAERLRRVAAVAGYVGRQRAARRLGWVVRPGLPVDVDVAVRTAADGLAAAEFDGGSYKRSADRLGPAADEHVVVAPGQDAFSLRAHAELGRTVGEAANFARSLANEPANVLTPTEFAARVAASAREVGLGVEVLDEARLRELGMGLLLSVSQGSVEAPKLVVLRHEPAGAPASPVLAFVGKGVTFDTGGISIKPADGMDRMKNDMAGGAAVAAAMRAIATLGVPRRVLGLIPMVENMPSGRATRPGDVIRGASGTTVEIINTDAEGRLILADALWHARQLGATHLIDVATLTGACVVALGHHVSGLFGSDDAWVSTVRSAGSRGGDRLWPMPIYEETREQLRSEIADLVNSAGRPGGASTAAAFLREFVGDTPWAHLDVAGTAWSEAKTAYQPKGATGIAVRTLVEIARA